MNRPLSFFLSCALLVASVPAWSDEPTSTQPPAGFQSIFNGKDLSGWEGASDFWSVKDGCMTGVTDGSLKYNRFIRWTGGKLKNFELQVQVKITSGGNSGINYRSKYQPELDADVVTGYQCDVVANAPSIDGMLYEERGRRILAHTGERVIIDVEGQPWVIGNMPVKTFNPDEWHDYRVLVQGNHHQHWIDGHPTADVIDLDEKNRALEGILGVQVHVGPAMQIQYRNFFVKHLADDLPIIAPEQAKIPSSAVQVVPQGGIKK